eukprot:TRINITY_DN1234_c0_g1_i1.p1 TRINITY_DN1234_c0_g1~~TRINITY_DN1234_c0_g1_i1.p1  ORF type:complete len:158 (-),score=39.58 TRINITY_DN1234_c0_g1_i1:182-655(-)
MPLGAASTAVSGEALPSAIVGLSGQGFESPDFNLQHLMQTLQKVSQKAGQASDAARHGEEAIVSAGAAAEQAARHADRVARLPAGEVGSEAFGDAEGTVPPRFRWGSAHPTLAIFGAKLQDVSSRTVASSEKVLQSPRGDGNLAGQAKKMDFIGNFL